MKSIFFFFQVSTVFIYIFVYIEKINSKIFRSTYAQKNQSLMFLMKKMQNILLHFFYIKYMNSYFSLGMCCIQIRLNLWLCSKIHCQYQKLQFTYVYYRFPILAVNFGTQPLNHLFLPLPTRNEQLFSSNILKVLISRQL